MAVHFWHRYNNFFQYISLVLSIHRTKILANYRENHITQLYQPSLAVPWIHSLFKLGGTNNNARSAMAKPSTFGNKLYLKLRRRLRLTRIPQSQHKQQALTLLYSLGKYNYRRYSTMKKLMQQNAHGHIVYALLRQSQYLDEPLRSVASLALKKILEKRKLPFPRPPLALALPFLSNPSFKTDIKRFLFRHICRSDHIPYHAPPSHIIEAKHRSLDSSLRNYRRNMILWTMKPPTTCNCKNILKEGPDIAQEGGHIAAPLSDLFPATSVLHAIANASAKESYYPSKQNYLDDLKKRILNWTVHHKMPAVGDLDLSKLMETQWLLHCQTLHTTNKHHFKDIVKLRTQAKMSLYIVRTMVPIN